MRQKIQTNKIDTTHVLDLAALCKAMWYINADSSVTIGNRAVLIAQTIAFPYGIARSYNNIGVAYDLKGNYTLSLNYHFKAMRIFDSLGNVAGLSASNNNIGEIFRYSGQYEKALKYYLKSVEFEKQTGRHSELGISLNSAGQAYWKLKQYDSAFFYLLRAETELSAENNSHLFDLMQVWNDLGRVYLEQRDYKKAEFYFTKVLANRQLVENEFQIANALAGMADVYLNTVQRPKALLTANEALKLFILHDARLEVRNVKKLMGEIYEKAGDFAQAMAYYKQSEELADSLFDEDMTRRIATVQFEYDEEKRTSEIEVLKKEKKILQQQNRYKFLGIIGLTGLLATGMLLALLILKRAKERKQANELLQIKNKEIETQAQELKDLDTYKSRVLSVVGHDLRGPLGGIKSVFELLETKQMQPEDFYKLSGSIKESVDEMYTTTDNLLNWANTQMKRVMVAPEVFAPRTEAEHTIKLLHTIAGYKAIVLYNEIPQNIKIKADKSHFTIILRNLVSNAIKFTRPKGYVEILAHVNKDFVEFAVKDNGVGIEPVILQSLHSPAHHPLSKQGLEGEKGTGLGLKLCRDFTELNGGTFWIESELNTGTNIHFTLVKA